MTLVLGMDAGGTSSRAVIYTLAGSVVGRGRAGGGSPMSMGVEKAFAHLGLAVRQALSSVDPAEVGAMAVGLAGSGLLRDPAARAAFDRTFADLGLTAAPQVLGDVTVAFAAGTAEPSGTVLISGTGAIAARITDHIPCGLADGYGWLLGDEGSAFWLGREAARTAIRAVAGADHPPGPLAELVVGHLLSPGSVTGVVPGGRGAGVGWEPVDLLATAVHARPPLALAELAPLVSQAAAAGDPVALAIVADAATRLAATVAEVRGGAAGGDASPIVLAGSVLTSEGPLRHAVQDLLRRRWRGPVTVAGDGAGAAAWLAARELVGPHEAEKLHAPMVMTGG